MNIKVLSFVAGLAMAALPSLSTAATCIGTKQTFTLTPNTGTATCAAVAALGANNISGNATGNNPDPLFALLGPGLTLLDKNDDATSGSNPNALTVANSTLGGNWSFSNLLAPLGKEFYNFVIAFKTGGNKDKISVWAAFDLSNDAVSGTWSTTGSNGLSHVNLYAKLRDLPPPATVPLPAAGLLLFGALGGLAALRRRKSA